MATQRYRDVCDRLGFRDDAKFVKILPGGAISFTTGKPDEVRKLLVACEREGLVASKALRAAAAR